MAKLFAVAALSVASALVAPQPSARHATKLDVDPIGAVLAGGVLAGGAGLLLAEDNRVIDDKAEVEKAVREFWGIPLEQPELDSMFTLYDSDGNGTLDMDEFRTMLANLDE